MKGSFKRDYPMDRGQKPYLMENSMKESGKREKSGMENYTIQTEKSLEHM